jgi:hypothetical protein
MWCRRGESNPRPRDYETLALPLSYAGTGDEFDAKGLFRKVSRCDAGETSNIHPFRPGAAIGVASHLVLAGQATSTLVTLTPPVAEVTVLSDNLIGHWPSQSEVGVCTV